MPSICASFRGNGGPAGVERAGFLGFEIMPVARRRVIAIVFLKIYPYHHKGKNNIEALFDVKAEEKETVKSI